MQQSWEPTPRRKRGDQRKNHLATPKLTTREVTKHTTDALSHIPAKVIADATGSSIKAAENAKQGLNAMSLAHFLNACRDIPELRVMAMELMGCDAETDPDFVRGISMLMNWKARRG